MRKQSRTWRDERSLMSFFHRVRTFHHTVTRVHLKRRAVPLAALVLTTSMTFPVIAVGMDTYTVTDGTNTDTVVLHESDAETALRQSSFDAGEYNITSVVEDENGYTVSVKAKYDVTVTADGQTKTIHTGDARVSDILRQAGVEVGENDIVEPAQDTMLTEATTIKVTRVTTKTMTETKDIAYSTETRETSELEKGKSRVAQEGVNGKEEITLEYTYHDGVQVSIVQTGSRVLEQPVNKIVENGTKEPVVTTSSSSASSGAPSSSSRTITMEATAYSGGGTTASGMAAAVGRVAVDPRVIPLGTRLYIEGYGYAVAADTGGAIKGNRIDLYMNSESACNSFGRRSVTVHVLG